MERAKATYMDADSPSPYANNPRLNDNAVDAVAASIKEFGFKVPIVVDGENVIINGHTRLKAAHKLGLKQVPVIVADDLTPEQAKAFRLADNKTGELAEWDMEKLDIELEGIDEIDMAEFGFDGSAIEASDGMWPIDDGQIGAATVHEHKMKLDGSTIILTEGEYNLVRSKLDQYLDANGASSGFAGWLVNGRPC